MDKKIHIRKATHDDVAAIEELMKRSMKKLGEGYYSPEQINSSCKYVCVPDLQVIHDGTFYVVENEEGKMVGCGGWSFRNTLYAGPETLVRENSRLNPLQDPARIRAMFVDPEQSGKGIGSMILETSEKEAKEYGFKTGVLGATLSGLDFYKAKGWLATKDEESTLPDGVTISVVQMVKEL